MEEGAILSLLWSWLFHDSFNIFQFWWPARTFISIRFGIFNSCRIQLKLSLLIVFFVKGSDNFVAFSADIHIAIFYGVYLSLLFGNFIICCLLFDGNTFDGSLIYFLFGLFRVYLISCCQWLFDLLSFHYLFHQLWAILINFRDNFWFVCLWNLLLKWYIFLRKIYHGAQSDIHWLRKSIIFNQVFLDHYRLILGIEF